MLQGVNVVSHITPTTEPVDTVHHLVKHTLPTKELGSTPGPGFAQGLRLALYNGPTSRRRQIQPPKYWLVFKLKTMHHVSTMTTWHCTNPVQLNEKNRSCVSGWGRDFSLPHSIYWPCRQRSFLFSGTGDPFLGSTEAGA